ncbi:hypothetical protein EV356DRAFT_365198 [Viridothelium virens]|uniref:Uncharacterized protein n=1 Tax=Viridothelium virens TaxID=1048519 RepID=A0A6A6GWY3_VIRVR|nr:hypothetical protein EV356DRAFT_365198 [Viridothelium virens]
MLIYIAIPVHSIALSLAFRLGHRPSDLHFASSVAKHIDLFLSMHVPCVSLTFPSPLLNFLDRNRNRKHRAQRRVGYVGEGAHLQCLMIPWCLTTAGQVCPQQRPGPIGLRFDARI